MCCEMFGISGESPRVPVSVERIFVFYLYLFIVVLEVTIMKTNKIGHFICGVLATYGLVVACGNMYNDIDTDSDNTLDQNPESDSRCPCILC